MNTNAETGSGTEWTPQQPPFREIQLIHAISMGFLSSSALGEIYSFLGNTLKDQGGFPIVVIECYNNLKDEMVVEYSEGISKPFSPAIPAGDSISGAVARSGRAIAEDNISERSEYNLSGSNPPDVKSYICIPVKNPDRVLGCITLADQRPRANLAAWLPTMEIIANMLAQQITRNISEDQLHTHEKFLLHSQRVGAVGHWTWNTLTNTVTWSDEMKRIFGLDPETVNDDLEQVINQSIHPDDIEKVRNLNEAVIHEGAPAELEYRIVRPDGSIHYVCASPLDKILNEHGAVISLSGIVRDITNSKKAAAALLESEEKYRLLFETINQGIIIQTADGFVTEANSAAHRIFGLEKGQIVNRTSFDARWDTIREDGGFMPGSEHPTMRALETGLPVHNVIMGVFNPHMNRHVWIRASASPLFHPGETSPSASFVVFEDIGEQKKAQDALKESEYRYRQLVENIHSGVAVYRPVNNGEDFIFIDFNRAAERIDNEPRENLIGQSVKKVRPNIEDFGLLDVFRRVLRTGNPEFHPIAFYKDQHISGWYENFVYKLPSGEIAAVFDNVTEQKKYEETLQLSEQKYRLLAENASDAIFACDMEKRLFYISPSLEKLTGYDAPSLMNRTKIPFIHPEDSEKMNRLRDAALRGEPPVNTEIRIIGADKQIKWLLFSWAPLLDNQNRHTGAQSSGHDITTLKLTQQQLEITLDEKETLLRELHHRTKNNMQVILSLLNLQRAHSRNPQMNEVLQDISHRVSAMSLVHQKLRRDGDLSHIRLDEYIKELTELMVRGFNVRQKRISVVYRLAPVEISIDAATPCGLIINELISNSLKHAFPDERDGVISLSLDRDDSGDILIHYADNGAGTPEGDDLRLRASLGVKTMLALAEHQLHGQIAFKTDSGVACSFRFPSGLYQRRI